MNSLLRYLACNKCYLTIFKKVNRCWSVWVTQSVKCQTLGFSSGHDLRIVRSSPNVRLHAQQGVSFRFSLSVSLSAPSSAHVRAHFLSLK